MCNEDERIDDLHRNGYKIIQKIDGFCFGIDAVLLSGFAKVKKNENVLDLCTGTGIIPILLEAKTNGKHFSAIEIQKDIANMAMRSVVLNNLQHKINIINGDLKECLNFFKPSSFDVITCNPPYMVKGTGYLNENTPKTISRHEISCNIDDVFSASNKMLKYGGRMYMVHRVERLVDIFNSARKYKIEPKTIQIVQSNQKKAPELSLLEFVKGGKPSLKSLPTLFIYDENGNYTKEINNIYHN